MKAEFWVEVEQAYFQALNLDPEARAAFLRAAFSSRDDIRREVESLLAHKSAAEQLTPISLVEVAREAFQDEAFETLIGRLIDDKYRVISYIGSGGFADVYLAEHIVLRTPLALKTPNLRFRRDPAYRRQFKAEAQRAAVLRHENIVRLYDVVMDDEDIFAVMDHVEGETLETRLKRLKRPLTMEEFFPIAIKCAAALGAAHKERIVHLDVKPSNIMVTTSEEVKVCDFGIAHRLPAAASNDTTKANERWQIAGTPAYMAPEVIFGANFNERADLFSLGVVFYEMLAGFNPFQAGAPDATFNRVRHETPPPITKANPKVDARLEKLIFQLLAKEPAQRIASADDLLVRFHNIHRSFNWFEHVLDSIGAGIRESRLVQVAALLLAIVALAAPVAWLYRDDLKLQLGFPAQSSVRPLVLVGDFDNRTGNPFFDLTVRDLLTIGLQQSHFVEVFPRERVRQTLERMRRPPETTLTLEVCREICAREGLPLLIIADIETENSGYRISARLMDAKSGQTRRVVSASLQRMQELAPTLDRLTRDVRSFLGEDAKQIDASLKPLADVTTSSQAALEQFSRAMELKAQNKFADAAVLLRSSLDLDPEFVMALGQLALVESTDKRLALDASTKAYAMRDRVTERERNFIVATYHLFRQQHDDAVRFFHAITLLYPSELSARRYLAQTYALMGNYDDAVKAYGDVVRADPESVEDKVMLAGYQTYAAQFDAAERSIAEVRRLDPANEHVYWVEGDYWLSRGDLALARTALTHIANSKTFGDYAALVIAQTNIYEGRIAEAINQLELDLIRFQNSSDTLDFARHFWLSELYSLVGRTADAERHVHYLAVRPPLPPFIPQLRAAALWSVRHNRTSLMENALSRLKQIESEYPGKFVAAAVQQIEGEKASVGKNSAVAREKLERAYQLWPDPLINQSLVNALIAAGEHERALVLLDKLVAQKGELLRWHPASLWVLAQLHAAKLEAGIHRFRQARQSYERFIQLWGNSPELRDSINEARLELQRLPAQ